jgi:uncharacterized membrane protein YcaP (DUF421 family)
MMNEFNGTEVIIRGSFITENLVLLGLSTEDIQEQLKSHNIKSVADVQYAEIQIDGNMYIESN